MQNRRVAELFAGVGGFRLGLEKAGWDVCWSNQWEPGSRTQHASDVYLHRFGSDGHVNDDIKAAIDSHVAGRGRIPDFDLLVGGFPCQDYSVAKTLNQASGIEGKKGVLWWQIHRLLDLKRPSMVLLENVDRLLKSPAGRRGRDFAIILACLADLGYAVEWRVVNAADYGFAQRRRRVFIAAYLAEGSPQEPMMRILRDGVMARALPVIHEPDLGLSVGMDIDGDLAEISDTFGGALASPFQNAGFMAGRRFWTAKVQPRFRGRQRTLGDVILPDADVPPEYFIPDDRVPQWRYLKGAKSEPRTDKKTGHRYNYTEGGIAFPDPRDRPSRTILTGEGGRTPSRFKHVVEADDGRLRRLTPIELERLNGFPDDWTAVGVNGPIPDGRRAFLMGNALVVGIVTRIGKALAALADGASEVIDLRDPADLPLAKEA